MKNIATAGLVIIAFLDVLKKQNRLIGGRSTMMNL